MSKIVCWFISCWLLMASGISLAAPVQISFQQGAKSIHLNGDWRVPEGVNPRETGAVLWIHGTKGTLGMQYPVQDQMQRWVKAGVPVLAITLSHGIDDRREPVNCDQPQRGTLELSFDEIAAWFDWLHEKGVKNVVLAGHSQGGQRVLLFAAHHPEPALRGVIAIAPAKGQPKAPAALDKAEKLVRAGQGDTLIRGPAPGCPVAEVAASTLLSYYGPQPDKDIRKAIAAIKVPVLVVAGARDEVVRGLPDYLRPSIGPHLTLRVVETADHFYRDNAAAAELGEIVPEFARDAMGSGHGRAFGE
ncbi:alpha/beta hydrolase [Thermithiobacillus plumbiphilus]|uniref:Alpha/beta fold hydrolase n=1 Tax=Thermithiobacillus plumbiphilus TaxID=1729899 RepID=A0ABU9D591_9PROT